MDANEAFTRRIAELNLTRAELAHRLNVAIEELTGRYGTVSERTIHRWTSGAHRAPHPRQGRALTAVFGCTLEELGFRPPSSVRQDSALQEDSVRRRDFMIAATTVATSTGSAKQLVRPSVGAAELRQLHARALTLVEVDQSQGGHEALEQAALAGAREALALQEKSASQRTRQYVYGFASDFLATAAFSCIDSFNLERATTHLNAASTVAGLSQDHFAQLRIWNLCSMLAMYQHRPYEAVSAARAGEAIAGVRRTPFLSALISAPAAKGYAVCGDRQGARRSIGRALDLLDRARGGREEPDATWATFFGVGQVECIASIVHQQLGEPQQAEAAAYRALAATPAEHRRNRSQITMYLASSQLAQGEVELACRSGHQAIDLMQGDPLPGRMKTLLGDFHRSLIRCQVASPAVTEWTERARAQWSR